MNGIRNVAKLACGLACALALSGCAGKARGVIQPTGTTAPGASVVEMLVMTTRQKSEDNPGEFFSGERARIPSFAEIDVSVPPDAVREIGEVQWPSRLPGDPSREFVTTRAQLRSLDEIRDVFKRRISKRRDGRVLVFVHGYNNRFEDAVWRFAQIIHDSKVPAVPVLFTWASRGRLLSYGFDRESANLSRDALEALLHALDRNPAVKDITILAHSMGNWVTMESLRQMAIRDGRVARKISHVMLAAPDVDVEIFSAQLAQMKGGRPDMTIFVSQADKALAVSQRIWQSRARLGQIDPTQEPFKSRLAQERIDAIDLTKVDSPDRLNHGTFAENPEVVRSIGKRLAGGQTLGDGEKAGLTHALGQTVVGAAGAVGSAATIVVTAPLAIVDSDARERIGYHAEQLGGHVGDVATGAGRAVTSPLGSSDDRAVAPRRR